jgi:hypothetical protein
VVNTVCGRHPKLNELKEKIVVPIANKQVKETLSKMEQGNVLTAHDVELVTTAIYKASLDEMSLKVHAPSYDGRPRAVSNPQTVTMKSLREELVKKKATGLMGFRDFTFDHAIEHGIRSNVQSQINAQLKKQQMKRTQILESEREYDMKLHKEAEELHERAKSIDLEKQQFKRAKVIANRNG